MRYSQRLPLAWSAARQLGFRQSAWYAWYQVLLRSGCLRRVTAAPPAWQPADFSWVQRLRLPPRDALRAILGERGIQQALATAEEVCNGKARLFGAQPQALQLAPVGEMAHWTIHDSAATLQAMRLPDIKYLWEPARFGWAFALGRAYRLTGNPRYAAAFWRHAEIFWAANPPYRGPNWESAQEVALRMMSLAWAGAVFSDAPASTPQRMARLTRSLAVHVARIPPTLAYARAQNNNHLLSEAAGLLTAATLLPEHPQAARWGRLGRRWWRWGLRNQIFEDGAYIQHSTNYHRLMLQLALWVHWLLPQAFTPRERHLTGRATRWLLQRCDPLSGGVPNLGPNDGAYIFPLANCPFGDYRPVLQAAGRVFLGEAPFSAGEWDEMGCWFFAPSPQGGERGAAEEQQKARISLRAVRFTSRPGHADQLHLDMWYAGRNLLLDAGTYLYNAAPPWENALTHAAVHNTVTVDGQDQMRRVGRFLYLDWAQAEYLQQEKAPDGSWQRLSARHDGYRHLGLMHQRNLLAKGPGHWLVEDVLEGLATRTHTFRLHWLIADGAWKVHRQPTVDTPHWVISVQPAESNLTLRLGIGIQPAGRPARLSLVRAGQCLYGQEDDSPTRGWVSPTYGYKKAALSLAIETRARAPLRFLTEIWLEENQGK